MTDGNQEVRESAWGQKALTLIAVLPILATVYQTLVLTDLVDGDIRRGIESDPGDATWLSAAWGLFTLYGVFAGLGFSQKFGPRNTLVAGLIWFMLGNFLCGLASSFPAMMVARMVEGLGKGICIILLRSYLYSKFDRMLFYAVLAYGIFAYSTRGTSPLIAVWINEGLGWRWVYWANIPLGFLGVALILCLVSPDPPRKTEQPGHSGKAEKPDALVIHLLVSWLMSLVFLLGWRSSEGGWTSNLYTLLATGSLLLFLALVLRLANSLKKGDNISRLLRSRSYLCAMGGRMLLLLQIAAVLGVLAKYMVELRGFPAARAGLAFTPATVTMALGFLICANLRNRDWRHFSLLLGVLGSAASIYWLAQADLTTPWTRICWQMAVWGFFVGALPASFLIDEVEGLDKSDLPVAAAFAIVVLATPLILVPSLMGTAIGDSKEAAFDHLRESIRPGRPVLDNTLERAVLHFSSRGLDERQAPVLAAGLVGAMVQLKSASLGIQTGLRFLAMITLILGLGSTAPLLLEAQKNPIKGNQ